MIVFLNDRFVPESEAMVSIFDRSFQYGDGLFETLPIYEGKPFLWERHLKRLLLGAEYLKIKLPLALATIEAKALELISLNGKSNALLKIQLSRGVGERGFSAATAINPIFVMTLHDLPELKPGPTRTLVTSSVRLPMDDGLAVFKTCNKLRHILARMEADQLGADDALLLNQRGHIAEASSSNIFWIRNKRICTAPVTSGILPGITRGFVLEMAKTMNLECEEIFEHPKALLNAQGVFLTLSSFGIMEVSRLDETTLARSSLTETLIAAYKNATSTS